jgi:hypothetical protein
MELGVRSLERRGGGGGYGQQHTPNRGMMMSNSRPAVSEHPTAKVFLFNKDYLLKYGC